MDGPGHDAACLQSRDSWWRLSGSAVFLHESGPAALAYSVETDGRFVAKRGTIRGFVGDRAVDHDMRREAGHWTLDGAAIDGLSHLLDLDFGFTPSTNTLALKRAPPPVRQKTSLPAAWFDLDGATLTELSQTYERLSETSFHYRAPSVGYEGVLEFHGDGFISVYPGLWIRVD